ADRRRHWRTPGHSPSHDERPCCRVGAPRWGCSVIRRIPPVSAFGFSVEQRVAAAPTSKLAVINGGLALKAPLLDPRKLLRVEHYLGRQARAAYNLGLPILEHYYLTSWLALKLWGMER